VNTQAPPPVTDDSETSVQRLARQTAVHSRLRTRHKGLIASLLLVVVLPVVLTSLYLALLAQPQYASETGFVVRQEESVSASQMLGGLSQVLGTPSASNSDLLFEFIQSQAIVRRINDELGIVGHYAQFWPLDPVYSIRPDITIEDLAQFWRRMIRITYDKSSGVIMVEVRARDAAMAQQIAREIVAQSEAMINTLNAQARRDSIANAEVDLDQALNTLRSAREALVAFQARTQILDPQADIQGRMGVVANLQQQLAEALVDYDLLLQATDSTDPRVRQLDRRIRAIEQRIAGERASYSSDGTTEDADSYPSLLATYEGLRVDVQFAEEIYRVSLTALNQARTAAERQQLYLATFISPTSAETAEYPRKFLLVALTAFFCMMGWSVGALVYYSLRDRG